jgi:hypothetical protein
MSCSNILDRRDCRRLYVTCYVLTSEINEPQGMKWSYIDSNSESQILTVKDTFQMFRDAYPAVADAPDHIALANFLDTLGAAP